MIYNTEIATAPTPQPPHIRPFSEISISSYYSATKELMFDTAGVSWTLLQLYSQYPLPWVSINSSTQWEKNYLLCLCQWAERRIVGKKMAENLLPKLRNADTRDCHHVKEFHSQLGMGQRKTSGPC